MLKSPKSLDLISRYLNDPIDPTLQKEIEEFRAASPENDSYFLEVEKIWHQSVAASRLEGVDLPLAVSKLNKNLNLPSTRVFRIGVWLRAVAATIVFIALGYWIYDSTSEVKYITKFTAKDQVDSVKLKDGSMVILAENSELKYPEKWEGAKREISLVKGQAFFKVAKDPSHPFKVNLRESNVVVLGTSFNIRITAEKIELGVRTGRVMFSPYQNGTSSILTAGQGLSYDIKKRELSSKRVENQDAWLTKELVFVDTPLEEVCEQLTNYYGTVIKLENNKHASKKLNANFKDQSLNNVLLILNETYNIKINRKDNQIHLITP